MNEKKRVLIGSPIHQKPEILTEFISSLLRLKQERVELGYMFIDDNEDAQSSGILQHMMTITDGVIIERTGRQDTYVRNEVTHYWNEHLIWKVAEYKNRIIQHAIKQQYDFLFLVDSDLVLHPDTVDHLVQANKDIISGIFWTQWSPNAAEQPQVWLYDQYDQWEKQRGEQLSAEEILNRYHQFINKMRVPGIYEVGGLGACTLISRFALTSGVNFKPISNLSFWGEDRHFCIRAAALGFQLYVDTHYPALHLYRDSDLSKVEQYKRETCGELYEPPSVQVTRSRPKLTLTMIVKNEADRFLKDVLLEHRTYIDEAVIIDDGSTDSSAEVCLEALQGIPIHIVKNDVSKFSNEVELRRQQWEETIKTEPEWILNLDADEMFERRFAEEVHSLLERADVDLYCFRLFDFWSETHYREDRFWQSHLYYRPFLLRYRNGFKYEWKETPQHCGRFPSNIFALPHQLSALRLKHLGWSKPEYRLEKYNRYMELDPEGRYGWKEQYLSILDENPHLVPWVE